MREAPKDSPHPDVGHHHEVIEAPIRRPQQVGRSWRRARYLQRLSERIPSPAAKPWAEAYSKLERHHKRTGRSKYCAWSRRHDDRKELAVPEKIQTTSAGPHNLYLFLSFD